ncbi:MAG: hypothetical protein V1718_00180 [archaeon]
MKKPIDELKTILDLPIAITAIAILIARFTENELIQLTTFIILLAIIVIRKQDSRIPIAFALILLMVSAFQLAFQTESAANQTAILAYYLLCVGVLAQFIEYIKNPEDDIIEEKEDIPKNLRYEKDQLSDTAKYIVSILKDITGKLKTFIKDAISALKGKLSAKKVQGDMYSSKPDYSHKPKNKKSYR